MREFRRVEIGIRPEVDLLPARTHRMLRPAPAAGRGISQRPSTSR
jgi:hypothetical protein